MAQTTSDASFGPVLVVATFFPALCRVFGRLRPIYAKIYVSLNNTQKNF
jgi:hypothetical protein